MKHSRSCRSGFTLLTMLAALAVLGIFALVATRALMMTMHVNTAIAKGQTLTARFDSAMRFLRQDTWNAAEITARDNTLVLKPFDGSAVTWSIEGRGTILRTSRERGHPQVQRWEMGIGGITLTVHGAEVVVHVPQGPYTRESERHLINQRRIAEGLTS